ncbi:MAG: efflux RND transporter periplasmic adaptor subunit [Sulfuricurvum sp.]|uniref:HlyD family secretion protein n=1 Tax=Sulfuricurvum sp. TaxID=2025608 RepID=UPI00260C076E|nr:efflux RND transporter periplasmic adaptor subunit [Sulfuricurvum sp.]MDD5159063.1 efflux RND transporter periplasmic adaptor subunit [Sulfuricurvum sp.]
MTFAKIKPIFIGVGIAAVIGGVVYTKMHLSKTTPELVTPNKEKPIESVSGVGTLEAKEIIILASKSTAKISALYADEGDRVRKGEVLARMELSELAGNQAESGALIDKSHAQMASQKALIEDLKAKKDLADTTLKRYQSLSKGGYVTQAELDSADATARSAHALLVSAQEGLIQSQHEIERARGSLHAINAKISDLSLQSPINGIVISRDAEAGSTIGSGSSVFRLANPETVWVKVYIDERQSGRLAVGQKATVNLRSFPDKKFSGEVRRIGVESDRITEERVVYIGLDTLPDPLHLGEQVEAQIMIAPKGSSHP